MTVTSKVLCQAKKAEGVQTTQYSSDDCKTIVDLFTVTNVSATTRTLSVNVAPTGGAPDDTNLVVKELSVLAGETKLVAGLIGRRMDRGDFISTLASDADALVIRIDGRQIT